MVFSFTSQVVSPGVPLFMGVDKFENEELIKWGWPEDVWFHVDKVSSAHVYLRLRPVRTHTHFKRYLDVAGDAPNTLLVVLLEYYSYFCVLLKEGVHVDFLITE